MPYYRPCPVCGAALDPGERCDCLDIEKAAPVLQHRSGNDGIRKSQTYEEQIALDYTKELEVCQV